MVPVIAFRDPITNFFAPMNSRWFCVILIKRDFILSENKLISAKIRINNAEIGILNEFMVDKL